MLFLIAALSHQCIENDAANYREERVCFFATYSRFQELATMAANLAQCPPTDCNAQCTPFSNGIGNELAGSTICRELGILTNYREPCGSYYADKVMPLVLNACGTFGGSFIESNVYATCESLDNAIFDPRLPACHASNAPTSETASFGVFYALITIGLHTVSGSSVKQLFDKQSKGTSDTIQETLPISVPTSNSLQQRNFI